MLLYDFEISKFLLFHKNKTLTKSHCTSFYTFMLPDIWVLFSPFMPVWISTARPNNTLLGISGELTSLKRKLMCTIPCWKSHVPACERSPRKI